MKILEELKRLVKTRDQTSTSVRKFKFCIVPFFSKSMFFQENTSYLCKKKVKIMEMEWMMLILLYDFENPNYTKRAWFFSIESIQKKRVFFTIPSIQKACYLFDLSIQGVLSLRFQQSKKVCFLFDLKCPKKRGFFSTPGILKSTLSFRSQKF